MACMKDFEYFLRVFLQNEEEWNHIKESYQFETTKNKQKSVICINLETEEDLRFPSKSAITISIILESDIDAYFKEKKVLSELKSRLSIYNSDEFILVILVKSEKDSKYCSTWVNTCNWNIVSRIQIAFKRVTKNLRCTLPNCPKDNVCQKCTRWNNSVDYCSRECLILHWKAHKEFCNTKTNIE